MVTAAPNVWSQMNYVPPRGPCNFKPNIMSSKCPCLRFMLHPLKSASSFECDGCGHHASFHSMENKHEDEIRRRWEREAKDKEEQINRDDARPQKRLRQIEHGAAVGGQADNVTLGHDFHGAMLQNGRPEGSIAELNRLGELLQQRIPQRASRAETARTRGAAARRTQTRAKRRNRETSDEEYREILDVD